MSLLSQAYQDYILSVQTEEEDELYQIREYYEGRQFSEGIGKREKYVALEIAKLIKKYPLVNVTQRTVTAVKDRLSIESIQCENEKKREVAQKWWDELELSSWQSTIYEASLRDKACVVIVGWDGKRKRPTFTINELYDGYGGTCRIHFDLLNDKEIEFVSKRWPELEKETGKPTGRERITLYYPDRIERYISEQGSSDVTLMSVGELKKEDPNITQNPQKWLDSDGNGLGFAAVVFENKGYMSECRDSLAPQAGINDAILDWHSSARYHGIPTLIFSKVQFKIDPITLREIEPEWSPGKGIAVDDGDIKRLQPTDVKMLFDGAVMPWIQLLAWQKGWPIHIFTQMPPSGETVRQMEGSLVSQCDDKKSTYTDSWRKMFDLFFALHKDMTGEEYEGKLDFKWRSSLSVSSMYDLELLQMKSAIGSLSQPQRLRELGYTETEIKRIVNERQKEQELVAPPQSATVFSTVNEPTTDSLRNAKY